jgi:hypothetical protein
MARVEEAFPRQRLKWGDFDRFPKATEAAIAALPVTDREVHIPLSQNMIRVTGGNGNDSEMANWWPARYVLLAAPTNHLYDYLPLWLSKFEAFLRTFYWEKARVDLDLGWWGGLVLEYWANSRMTYAEEYPALPTGWTLKAYRPSFAPLDGPLIKLLESGEIDEVPQGWRPTTD